MLQIAQHRPRKGIPLRVLIDLTSLPKCGKFFHLGTATDDPELPDPWVRMLNGLPWLTPRHAISGGWTVARPRGVFESGAAWGIRVHPDWRVSY